MPHSSSATRLIRSDRTQIQTWVSIRRGAEWYIGIIFIWVFFKERKHQSMIIRPLYLLAASCMLALSSLVSKTHFPSYLAALRTLPRSIRTQLLFDTVRYRLKRLEASSSMARWADAFFSGYRVIYCSSIKTISSRCRRWRTTSFGL